MKIEYNNLYIHFVLTTLYRARVFPDKNRPRIEKYITGIVAKNSSKLYAIYANPEHVHFLVSKSPGLTEEELATVVADSSEKFINENRLANGHFRWQQTASAFSVSKSDVDKVCKYILDQAEHHRRLTYTQEYDLFIRHYQDTIRKNQ